jgi:hypothetical protein
MKTKAIILILFAILLGCKKDNNLNLVLNSNLTDCAANSTCTYDYYDNANFANWSQPVSGDNRVFWYKSVNNNLCDATTEIYFKTSLSNDEFEITSNQIAAGQIAGYNVSCACCDYQFFPGPVGGDIKGKRSDASHWLINATIILGNSANDPRDTVVINQYFTIAQKLSN